MGDLTLAEFLAARLGEAATGAWAIHDVAKCDALLYEENMADAARRDPDCDCGYPARVLREVEAGRKILDLHLPDEYGCQRCEESPLYYPCSTLRALVAVYSDHPDYREEWKP